MSIPDDVLEKLAPQPYAEVRRSVRDGDILLCSADDGASRLIRWATRSRWSHIAIAFRIEEIDRVIVLESVIKFGVRAVPLSTFISRTSSGTAPYPGRILLARHDDLATDRATAALRRMAGFAFDRLGEPFAMGEVPKILLRILLGGFDVRLPESLGPDDEFICSEYVARCYAAMGVEIPWDGLGFIGPGDFATDPAIRPLAQIQTR